MIDQERRKYRSPLINLALLGLIGWGLVRLQIDPGMPYELKLLSLNIALGALMFLLIGVFLAEKRTAAVSALALLGALAAAVPGLVTQLTSAATLEMTLFSLMLAGAAVFCQLLGIGCMGAAEALGRRIVRTTLKAI